MNTAKFLYPMLALGFLSLLGCVSPDGASNIKIKSARTERGTLVIAGENLDQVVGAKISDGKTTASLVILTSKSSEIRAQVSRAFTLVVGQAYNLIVSTAHADETVPLTVEVPAGYLDPSVIKGANAAPGTVLKWNGSGWVPAPDYVGVGGNSLTFAGYTDASNGNLGGLKGANAKCNAAFPGSHWANLDEIMKLGPDYPWTYDVWIRGLLAGDHNFAREGSMPFTRGDECRGWTQTWPSGYSNPEEGTVLSAGGMEEDVYCTGLYRLACVK